MGHAGDHRGRHPLREQHARSALEQYVRAAQGLHSAGLEAYISVKPTHFGLSLSEPLALELYTTLARRLDELGLFLRVDDFAAAFTRMTRAGVTFVEPPRDGPYGRVAVFVDLEGNRWDLLGPRPGA